MTNKLYEWEIFELCFIFIIKLTCLSAMLGGLEYYNSGNVLPQDPQITTLYI